MSDKQSIIVSTIRPKDEVLKSILTVFKEEAGKLDIDTSKQQVVQASDRGKARRRDNVDRYPARVTNDVRVVFSTTEDQPEGMQLIGVKHTVSVIFNGAQSLLFPIHAVEFDADVVLAGGGAPVGIETVGLLPKSEAFDIATIKQSLKMHSSAQGEHATPNNDEGIKELIKLAGLPQMSSSIGASLVQCLDLNLEYTASLKQLVTSIREDGGATWKIIRNKKELEGQHEFYQFLLAPSNLDSLYFKCDWTLWQLFLVSWPFNWIPWVPEEEPSIRDVLIHSQSPEIIEDQTP